MTDRTSQMERLLGYYVGYFATHLIRLVVDCGLFSALDAHPEGANAGDIAVELGFDQGYVEHFLRAAFALQLLDYDPVSGLYRLAAHMDILLARPEDYRYMGYLARMYVLSGRDFGRMEELLETGGTYTFQEHDENLIEAAADATIGLTEFVSRAVLRRLPGLRGRDDLSVLDIGCGTGGMLVALAKAYPRGRVVGVDTEPRSVEKAVARIRAAGLEERVEARLAAAEEVDERAAFDLVTMIQALHETRQDVRGSILSRTHAALRPGGLLLIVDEPYPHEPSALRDAPVAAITQFVEAFMGNVLLSPQNQQQIVEKAGFQVLSQMTPAPGLICVTIAQRS
jgi:ubiquinone/menaquinone biosynthesis C-methylase UbiE